jgi:predicted RNA-binding protein YlqC (UPF0109 family)
MVVDFIQKYTKLIVSHKNSVIVKETKRDKNITSLDIYVHPEDIGKVIGKNANMISAINTFIGIYSLNNKTSFKAFVKDISLLSNV